MPHDIKEIQNALKECLKRWDATNSDYGNALLAFRMVQASSNPLRSDWNNIKQAILELIDTLQIVNPSAASLIHQHYITGEGKRQVLDMADSQRRKAYRALSTAMTALTNQLLVQEEALLEARRQLAFAQIAHLRNDPLIGRDSAEIELVQKVHHAATTDNAVIYVSGLGGIGKTSLLTKVIRRIVHEMLFDHVVWIEYRPISLSGDAVNKSGAAIQMMNRLAALPHVNASGLGTEQRLTKIQQALRTSRHLVIVDNVEDVHVSEYLQDQISILHGKSAFIVGSRVQPRVGAQNHIVPPLSVESSLALLRHVAKQSSLAELASLSDKQLIWIYEVVGGNPLGLKLAANLTRSLPYDVLLKQLRTGTIDSTNKLFRRIFSGHWAQISEDARELLCTMQETTEEAEPSFVQAMSGLDDNAFWNAVEELVVRSLLEVQGSLEARRYGIHRLTAAFLDGHCD
ncbi:MAG: NB-ARC domain-containing protein [Candidatus Promineifilaceae bacterium]